MGYTTKLKGIRLKLARKEDIPAYCVFSDRDVEALKEGRPETIKELIDIKNWGGKYIRLQKYGAHVLSVFTDDSVSRWTKRIEKWAKEMKRKEERVSSLNEERRAKEERQPSDRPSNAGKKWEEADLKDLVRRYKKGETFEKIAAKFQRTVYGIQCQLEGYRLIERVPGQVPLEWVPFGTITNIRPETEWKVKRGKQEEEEPARKVAKVKKER